MLHDDPWLWDGLVDGLVRQDVGAVQVKLVVNDHVLPQHCHILHAHLTAQINPVRVLQMMLVYARKLPVTPLLTHWPTEELHPTMQLSNQECDRTLDPFSTVQRFILTPSSTITPAPMVTFGPMVQFSPICAVGSFVRKKMEDRHCGVQTLR